MTFTGITGLLIIAANIFISYEGFKNSLFFDRYKFKTDPILIQKDYKRLVTSGFLHGDWNHLIFNMLTLFLFSSEVEGLLGPDSFLIIYFAALIGGNLLSLFINRNDRSYSAIGASGAVCGVVFASIAVFPGMHIWFFPAWLYGLAYVLYSIYGIKAKRDNIGHEAHLGGALVGMLVALIIKPDALVSNYITILLIAVPSLVFIYIIAGKPHLLLNGDNIFKKKKKYYDLDDRYNDEKARKQKEVDRILEKISKKGMHSLTSAEKESLKEYSERLK